MGFAYCGSMLRFVHVRPLGGMPVGVRVGVLVGCRALRPIDLRSRSRTCDLAGRAGRTCHGRVVHLASGGSSVTLGVPLGWWCLSPQSCLPLVTPEEDVDLEAEELGLPA